MCNIFYSNCSLGFCMCYLLAKPSLQWDSHYGHCISVNSLVCLLFTCAVVFVHFLIHAVLYACLRWNRQATWPWVTLKGLVLHCVCKGCSVTATALSKHR